MTIKISGEQLTKDLKNKLWLVGNDLTSAMVRRAPVDTGMLKNSIRFEVLDNGDIEFRMVDYAKHVEYGTRKHQIRIKNKKILSDGKSFFGKEITHPGTTPQPFIRPALHQLKNIIKDRLDGAEITVKLTD